MEGRDEKGRFTKDYAGGPGRPKGTLDILTAIRHKLEECPEGEKRTYLDLLVQKYVNHVLEETDGVAIRDLIDRYNGKPMQRVQMRNDKDAEWLELLKDIKNEAITETAENPEELSPGIPETTDT